jgi:hypothetical protein
VAAAAAAALLGFPNGIAALSPPLVPTLDVSFACGNDAGSTWMRTWLMHWNDVVVTDAAASSPSRRRRRRDRSTTGSTRSRYSDWLRRLPTCTVAVRCRRRWGLVPSEDVVVDAAASGSTKLATLKIDSTGRPTSVSRSGRSASSRKARFTCCVARSEQFDNTGVRIGFHVTSASFPTHRGCSRTTTQKGGEDCVTTRASSETLITSCKSNASSSDTAGGGTSPNVYVNGSVATVHVPCDAGRAVLELSSRLLPLLLHRSALVSHCDVQWSTDKQTKG